MCSSNMVGPSGGNCDDSKEEEVSFMAGCTLIRKSTYLDLVFIITKGAACL